MERADVVDQLVGYIGKEVLDGRDIGLDAATPLLEWGIINSLEIVKLVSFIQERFNVAVPGEKVSAEYFQDATRLAELVLELADETAPTKG